MDHWWDERDTFNKNTALWSCCFFNLWPFFRIQQTLHCFHWKAMKTQLINTWNFQPQALQGLFFLPQDYDLQNGAWPVVLDEFVEAWYNHQQMGGLRVKKDICIYWLNFRISMYIKEILQLCCQTPPPKWDKFGIKKNPHSKYLKNAGLLIGF